MMDDVVVRHFDGLAVAGGGKTNLIGHLALTMVGLLDRAGIQTLHGQRQRLGGMLNYYHRAAA